VAAVVVGMLAVIMLLDTLAWGAVYAFDWPAWAGFGIVALPLLLIAIVLGVMSRTLLSRERYMPKSVDTLKENAEWLRARTQS
jgi:NADH:ubiquinone oxidoreductase subunit 6 (subunit J)